MKVTLDEVLDLDHAALYQAAVRLTSCPKCQSAPGEPCRVLRIGKPPGNSLQRPHRQRLAELPDSVLEELYIKTTAEPVVLSRALRLAANLREDVDGLEEHVRSSDVDWRTTAVRLQLLRLTLRDLERWLAAPGRRDAKLAQSDAAGDEWLQQVTALSSGRRTAEELVAAGRQTAQSLAPLPRSVIASRLARLAKEDGLLHALTVPALVLLFTEKT